MDAIMVSSPDLIITDDPNCASLRDAAGDVGIVVLTQDAISEAYKNGADACVPPDVRPAVLTSLLARLAQRPKSKRAAQRAQRAAFERLDLDDFSGIVGSHPVMIRLLKQVSQVAKSRATVWIFGETGTGKEMIAAAIHRNSKRVKGPFIKLNCSALSSHLLESELFGHERGAFTGAVARRMGRFERAHGGTLFLDEISEVPPMTQVKLLRFLQEREFERVGGDTPVKVDVRVVAASNRDLQAMVADGQFREDLFYRLNVVRLTVPPLRVRPSDIMVLANHFLAELAQENDVEIRGFDDDARRALLLHTWPGNVRALRNAIETAVVMCEGDLITVADLPIAEVPTDEEELALMVPGVSLAALERWAILRTLQSVGTIQGASKVLGISRRKIQYRLREWGVSMKDLTQRGQKENVS